MSFNSAEYWEKRYQSGRNSGAGSYGRLAKYKAQVLNEFVAENNIESVIEWGCGDGNQLKLAKYPKYIGLDVSEKSIEICQSEFANDHTKEFIWINPVNNHVSLDIRAELSLSLDVIFHLVEDEVFEDYMKNLFNSATRFVIIYSSNMSDTGDTAEHVKHRKFTDWIGEKVKSWRQMDYQGNPFTFDGSDADNTSFADFYIYQKI